MGPSFGPLVITVLLGLIQTLTATVNVDEKFEPMVAFMCNKPAMHRVTNGWEYDTTTDCLKKKTDILQYCQELYPDHEITNIVEASYETNVPEWPSKNGKRHTHHVRPYRCIDGPFQSDALLVPQHCVFDHHHDTSVCQEFKSWNDTAISMCRKREMVTESFAMLLECGLDRFNGVEFVCCPKGKTSDVKPVPLVTHSDEKESSEEDASSETKGHEHKKTQAANKPSLENVYRNYLKGVKNGFKNEHEWYLSARKFMRKDQQSKITKLMKEWQAAREHVEELKKTDTKSAKTLGHEITERFQSLYESYEQQDLAEKKQIVALHQQHIQGDLNKRKREAIEKFQNALQEEKRDPHKILRYLRAYFRAEEKDKMHTVNHYQHVKYTEPAELKRIRPHYKEHIKLIDERLNQTLGMLSRYPDVEEVVKPEILKFALRYRAVDASAKNVILNDNAQPQQSADDYNYNDQDDNKSSSEEKMDETHEDEHAYEHNDHFVAHVVNEGMHVDDRSVQEVAIHGVSNQVGSTFGIAIGSVAVFVIIVVAIVMLRRRNHRQPVTHGYVEVDPAASPEERHVANMQMNGYENPTYRYFEMSQTSQ
ncbi:amyloid-beta precursor-like protein [Haliotis asinina]|uniref:amyloid-beta precursor-like protein n=1 Tax=Haliotis asinina TaxID=109174 RepID=UPI0035327E82